MKNALDSEVHENMHDFPPWGQDVVVTALGLASVTQMAGMHYIWIENVNIWQNKRVAHDWRCVLRFEFWKPIFAGY
jgi:hypothetical protein